jgi:FMN phosphatase YigB (HAD superfamily)
MTSGSICTDSNYLRTDRDVEAVFLRVPDYGAPMPVLLCDVGNVLVSSSMERVLTAWRQVNDGVLAVSTDRELRDEAYRAFQTGDLGESEYARHLRVLLGWRGTDVDLVEIYRDVYGAIDLDVLQVLGELRSEGWDLVAVVNTDPWRHDVLRERLGETASVFSRWVTSTQVRARKTDQRFLTEAVRGYPAHGLRLFVDDRPENVAAARGAGLDAHLFRNAAGLRESCTSLGSVVL